MKSEERLIFLIIIAILSISLMSLILSDKTEYKAYINTVIDDRIEKLTDDIVRNTSFPITTEEWYDVRYIGGEYYARFPSDTDMIFISEDGLYWEPLYTPLELK